MLEARSFVKSFDEIKQILEKQNAIYKGEYIICDKIFSPKDKNKTLSDIFLRLRLVPKNIWNEKEVVVAIKETEIKEVGKDSKIPLKKQFDGEKEAQDFIKNNLLHEFEYSFEFKRTGWQYDLDKDQVDLEDIEGLLSIEIKSETEDGLKNLAKLFNMEEIIKDPSVIKIKKLLNK